jgi:hypothetical protein
LNSVSESWTGMGVIAGFFPCVVMAPCSLASFEDK